MISGGIILNLNPAVQGGSGGSGDSIYNYLNSEPFLKIAKLDKSRRHTVVGTVCYNIPG